MAQQSGTTLTDVTYVGRQVVKFGGIGLVLLIVGRMALITFITYWQAIHPPAPPPPTVGFGILPTLRFPEKLASDKPTSYSLELPRGTFPSFGDRAKVFLMPQSTLNLSSDQQAKQIAAAHNFVFPPEVLTSRLYRWRKSQPLESTLQLDIQSLQMKLTTNYASRPELLSNKNLPDPASAVTLVKNFLSDGQMLPLDMATVSGQVLFKKSLGTQVIEAVSFSDADFLQVDLQRTPVDLVFPMYSPNGIQGAVSALVGGGSQSADNIYQLSYNYHPVDYDQVHTYPLRPPSEAWKILQGGEGYVAQKGINDTAVVREVTLGYYDDFEEQPYLQPIYVFTGDGGFIGYVSALDQKYVQTAQTAPVR